MYARHDTGKIGEDLAVHFLEEKLGYKILCRNFSCKLGEIDIIARNGDEIVFVEVKTRSQKLFGAPVEAIDLRKKFHIYRVAEYFIMKKSLEDCFFRFDAIEVFSHNDSFRVRHLKNVIYGSPYNDVFYNSFEDVSAYEWDDFDDL